MTGLKKSWEEIDVNSYDVAVMCSEESSSIDAMEYFEKPLRWENVPKRPRQRRTRRHPKTRLYSKIHIDNTKPKPRKYDNAKPDVRVPKYKKLDLDGTGVIVERPPMYTNHARRRMAEGRCGSYIIAKEFNGIKIITVLPSRGRARLKLPTLGMRRKKSNVKKYKYRA